MHSLLTTSKRNLGTFAFLQPGWWVVHIAAIMILLTIGYCLCDE